MTTRIAMWSGPRNLSTALPTWLNPTGDGDLRPRSGPVVIRSDTYVGFSAAEVFVGNLVALNIILPSARPELQSVPCPAVPIAPAANTRGFLAVH